MNETTPSAYSPLNVLKAVVDDIWIVDSGPLRRIGIPIPVRMTIVRLGNGDVLIHSPTKIVAKLRQDIERLGPVRHLIAPNSVHWLFLEEWQRNFPGATTWVAPGLAQRFQVRRSGLRLDRELTQSGRDWVGELDTAIIPGAGGFREVAFFHNPTRTLLLTDLIVNLDVEDIPYLLRPAARLAGVMAPHGKAPIYLRLVINMQRAEAARAAAQLVDWGPERVIFSHGRWFESDGCARLRTSLRWLLS